MCFLSIHGRRNEVVLISKCKGWPSDIWAFILSCIAWYSTRSRPSLNTLQVTRADKWLLYQTMQSALLVLELSHLSIWFLQVTGQVYSHHSRKCMYSLCLNVVCRAVSPLRLGCHDDEKLKIIFDLQWHSHSLLTLFFISGCHWAWIVKKVVRFTAFCRLFVIGSQCNKVTSSWTCFVEVMDITL